MANTIEALQADMQTFSAYKNSVKPAGSIKDFFPKLKIVVQALDAVHGTRRIDYYNTLTQTYHGLHEKVKEIKRLKAMLSQQLKNPALSDAIKESELQFKQESKAFNEALTAYVKRLVSVLDKQIEKCSQEITAIKRAVM